MAKFHNFKTILFLIVILFSFSQHIASFDLSSEFDADNNLDLTRVVRAPNVKWMRFGKRGLYDPSIDKRSGQVKWMRFGKRSEPLGEIGNNY
uniref:Uncharacterized protein n=1 Tax=Parastrongyloides trichosuri TaxID=131310 RepID=A0A0N4ZF05_PARTI